MLNDLWSVYVKVASLNENVARRERKEILEHGLKKPYYTIYRQEP